MSAKVQPVINAVRNGTKVVVFPVPSKKVFCPLCCKVFEYRFGKNRIFTFSEHGEIFFTKSLLFRLCLCFDAVDSLKHRILPRYFLSIESDSRPYFALNFFSQLLWELKCLLKANLSNSMIFHSSFTKRERKPNSEEPQPPESSTTLV